MPRSACLPQYRRGVAAALAPFCDWRALASNVQRTLHMRAALREKWERFKALPAGERFQRVHAQQRNAPLWSKILLIAAAVLSLGVAVLLSVLPGPAFVFYGLTAALLAVESAWAARLLDRAEVALRRKLTRFKRRREAQRGRQLRQQAHAQRPASDVAQKAAARVVELPR